MYSSAALGAEQMLFDRAPQLSGAERRRVFELPVAVWSAANDIQSVSGKISFLISAGYFRSARRFFLTSDFHDRDIAYVAARLGIDGSRFDHAAYSARTRQRHRPQIMELAGFRPFDGDAARALQTELETMARSHLRIPTQAGRGYRFEAGQGSDLKPATIPR
jgi:hypothetical protein